MGSLEKGMVAGDQDEKRRITDMVGGHEELEDCWRGVETLERESRRFLVLHPGLRVTNHTLIGES
jgi:hypothetical protein